ncbi:pyridoxal phosphate-dependent aminotransferase [Brevundimonas sp.]|uniref:pyridoxal phosphate-dependent aminotransferase n=1 Tax=Brevundimonas sp. TaxID=1871086 RepID=UPI0025BF7BC9|nr:pyridoxal phosphate-dependent aminotransferase [Brevundimonas sp.]
MRVDGADIIDLTLGEPDFDTPDHVKQSAQDAMWSGKTRYTQLTGAPDTIDAILARISITYELCFQRQNVIVTNGAKQALHNAFSATLNPGDEVILPTPYWTTYPDIIRLEGGVVREVPGLWSLDKGWRLDIAAIERAITPRTRWILLNSPCNPSGAVYSPEDLAALAGLVARHDGFWVMSDDIYQDIAFPAPAPMFAARHPEVADRTLIIGGVSKAYAMTGWRVGWAVGPADLIRAMAAVQSQTTSAPSSISQAAAAIALRGPQTSVLNMVAEFKARRDVVVDRLNAIPGLECALPGGAFYAFPRITGALHHLGLGSDTEFCDALLNAGVAAVPGSAFGAPGFIRLSYAASMAELEGACDRIEQLCAQV